MKKGEIKILLKPGINPPKSEAVRKALQRLGITFSEEKDGNYVLLTKERFAKMAGTEVNKTVELISELEKGLEG